MHGYDVHVTEALYLSCGIHDPWDRGSGPRADSIWQRYGNVLI